MEVPTDEELVLCAAATYDPAAEPHFHDVKQAVRVFLKTREDGFNIIAVEGTHDPLGWLVNFIGLSIVDQQGIQGDLGFVHAGFYAAAVAALPRCILIAHRGPYAICGHSLGAAMALLIGALLIDDGLAPEKIAAFAPPRVGGEQFVKIVNAVPCTAYRYGADPVTEVPVWLPRFPYRQLSLIQLPGPVIGRFDISARVGCHRVENYVSGVKSLVSASENQREA